LSPPGATSERSFVVVERDMGSNHEGQILDRLPSEFVRAKVLLPICQKSLQIAWILRPIVGLRSGNMELLGEGPSGMMYLDSSSGIPRLIVEREKACEQCGELFRAQRRGRRGPFPKRCPSCSSPKPKRKPGEPKRGPIRSGAEYLDSSGYFVVSPIDASERKYPTSRKCGRIRRSHLVWNRAHPNDLVQQGEHVHHKNRDTTDDRIENLEKLTPLQHATEHDSEARARLHIAVARTCVECHREFMGRYASKYCSDACRRQSTNRKNRRLRREASAHPCVHCGAMVSGQRLYCTASACQAVRRRLKQERWQKKVARQQDQPGDRTRRT
jgi:hypothetical protein